MIQDDSIADLKSPSWLAKVSAGNN